MFQILSPQGGQGITKNRSQNGRDGRGDRDRADGRGGPPGKKVIMGLSIQEKVRKGAKFEYVYLPMNVRSKSDVRLDPETTIMK